MGTSSMHYENFNCIIIIENRNNAVAQQTPNQTLIGNEKNAMWNTSTVIYWPMCHSNGNLDGDTQGQRQLTNCLIQYLPYNLSWVEYKFQEILSSHCCEQHKILAKVPFLGFMAQ
jgi:hypothetical protein